MFVLGQGWGQAAGTALSKGTERRRGHVETRGPMECAAIFRKVGLCLVLMALTAGKEV